MKASSVDPGCVESDFPCFIKPLQASSAIFSKFEQKLSLTAMFRRVLPSRKKRIPKNSPDFHGIPLNYDYDIYCR